MVTTLNTNILLQNKTIRITYEENSNGITEINIYVPKMELYCICSGVENIEQTFYNLFKSLINTVLCDLDFNPTMYFKEYFPMKQMDYIANRNSIMELLYYTIKLTNITDEDETEYIVLMLDYDKSKFIKNFTQTIIDIIYSLSKTIEIMSKTL